MAQARISTVYVYVYARKTIVKVKYYAINFQRFQVTLISLANKYLLFAIASVTLVIRFLFFVNQLAEKT